MIFPRMISLLFTNLVLQESSLHGYLALAYSRCLLETVAESRYVVSTATSTPDALGSSMNDSNRFC